MREFVLNAAKSSCQSIGFVRHSFMPAAKYLSLSVATTFAVRPMMGTLALCPGHCSNPAGCLNSVHQRHLHVHNNNVELLVGNKVEGLSSIPREHDVVALPLKTARNRSRLSSTSSATRTFKGGTRTASVGSLPGTLRALVRGRARTKKCCLCPESYRSESLHPSPRSGACK